MVRKNVTIRCVVSFKAERTQQRAARDISSRIVQVLSSTGRVMHLAATLVEAEANTSRQTPPTLPGPPVSEILIAQRRGEL